MGALVFLALCLDLGEMDRAQSLHARSFRGVENQTFSASQLAQAADSMNICLLHHHLLGLPVVGTGLEAGGSG